MSASAGTERLKGQTMRGLNIITVVSLALLAFTATQVSCQRTREGITTVWNVHQYPDPHSLNQDDQRLCGRFNVSSVCDPNSVISRTDADAIDNMIDAVYRETTCQCYHCRANNHGYIIRVALMPSMERIFTNGENTTMGQLRDAQMYSYILTQRWRMEGACNETLLILYAKHDNLLYTLTRQNTKLKLSNDDVKRISLMVRHFFDEDDTIADGIMEMISRYRLIFEGKHQEALSPSAIGGRRG